MQPQEIYLDTSLLVGWFKHILERRKKTEEPQIIEFLNNRPEIKKYISSISIAEIIEVLKSKEFKNYKLENQYILDLIETLRNTLNLIVIEEFEEKGKKQLKNIFLDSQNIVDLTFLGGEVIDAIHIDISKSNNLYFITRDEGIGKTKEIYPKIMGLKHFMKQFTD